MQLNDYWGRVKAAFGFGADQIITQAVSKATHSSHRVIIGKTASYLRPDCFDQELLQPVT